jgi:O-6-methylguanine DNA methyltransferase
MSDERGAAVRELSCNEVVHRLPALVAGDLEDGEIDEIDHHIRACWECDMDVRQSRGLASALTRLWSRRLDCLGQHLDRPASPPPVPFVPDTLADRLKSALDRGASYAPVKTDLGVIHLVATDHGLARVFFPGAGEAEIDYWCRSHDLIPLYDDETIEPYAEQMHDYFAGRRRNFDVPLDLRTLTPFMRSVLQSLRHIPYGDVRNYREIASEVGNPNAQRAVGNAVKRNPVPIVVPCHRVIRTDGKIGGYAGGQEIKERLLQMEGALLAS